MTDYAVFYAPAAWDDLQAIYNYITNTLGNRIAGNAQEARIRKEIQSLNHFPLRYEQVAWEPWHSMGVRKLPIDNFVAYYSVDEAAMEVIILRIFYGGQNVEQIISSDLPTL